MNLQELRNIPTELERKSFNPFQPIGNLDLPVANEKFENIRVNCSYYQSPSVCKAEYVANCLNILHVNTRSILSDLKFEEFQLFINSSSANWHVINVCESWLTDDAIQTRQLDGYTGYFKNRTNKTGGGIVIYVSDKYISSSTEIKIDTCIESLFVKCQLNQSQTIIVGEIYNPPSSDTSLFISELEVCLNKLNELNKTTYICGDFNLDLFSLFCDDHCQEFFNVMTAFGYLPTIFKTTRASDTKLSLLDNIFCNNLESVRKSGIIYDDSSDHFPIFVSSLTELNSRKHEQYTIFDKRKIDDLSEYIIQHLDTFEEIDDPEVACNTLISVYQSGIQKFSKTVTHTRKTSPLKPWITPAILASINRRHELFLEKSKTPNGDLKRKYNSYRNILNDILRQAKKNYIQQQLEIHKNNSKKMWQILNENVRGSQNNKQLAGSFRKDDGELTNNKSDIADSFNNFFISIGEKLQQEIPPDVEDPLSYIHSNPAHTFTSMENTNAAELCEIIKNMKNVGGGIDHINAYIFKKTYLFIINQLVHLINLCLTKGVFPSSLKIAVVKPIFKAGDKSLFNNYRPISILPYISKIVEKILHSRIMTFLLNSNILSNCQYGFQKNKSTYMPLLLIQENVTKSFENGNSMCGLYLDLKKAFDTVDHEILLCKLEKYGFGDASLEIMKSYLSNRLQCVDYKGVMSSLKHVKIGVPQGSILGPLLFLLYINDLPNTSTNVKFLLFADDTALFVESTQDELQRKLDEELPKVCKWLEANKLSLNTDKTYYQLYSNSKTKVSLSVKLNKTEIREAKTVRYLGVLIDNDLKWKSHIIHTSNIVSRNIGIINRSKYFLPIKHRCLLYNALILPYLNYCCLIWGHSCKTHLVKLFNLQKRIIRILDDQPRLAHTGPIFAKLKLLKLMDIAKLQTVTVMHNIICQSMPSTIMSLFQPIQNNPRESRLVRHFLEPFTTKSYRTRTFAWIGPRIWNAMIAPQFPLIRTHHISKRQIKQVAKQLIIVEYGE